MGLLTMLAMKTICMLVIFCIVNAYTTLSSIPSYGGHYGGLSSYGRLGHGGGSLGSYYGLGNLGGYYGGGHLGGYGGMYGGGHLGGHGGYGGLFGGHHGSGLGGLFGGHHGNDIDSLLMLCTLDPKVCKDKDTMQGLLEYLEIGFLFN